MNTRLKNMPGRLNIFQKVMLQWDEMHPYNAVHVVSIQQTLDLQRLAGIVNTVFEGYGLTNLSVDRGKNAFVYHGGAAGIEIEVIQGHADTDLALQRAIETQINTRFYAEDICNPFRAFVVCGNDSFYLGLAYWHFISDAEMIIFLLKDIAARYRNEALTDNFRALNLYPKTYCRLVRVRPKSLFGWTYTLPAGIASIKKSFRPGYRDLNDLNNCFVAFTVDPERFHMLAKTGKRLGATLHDLFLALLFKSLAQFAKARFSEQKRRNISLASIVNIRKDLNMDANAFGVFLGLFTVSHALPEDVPTKELVRDIHSQTLKIKKYQLYLRSLAEIGLGHLMFSDLTPARREKFYPKNYPLLGGITNINLNALQKPFKKEPPEYYLRAVSTGPVSPLVFSITTAGERLCIGVSFRTALYSKTDINKIISGFSEAINEAGEVLL